MLVNIPEELYTQLHAVAEATQQPIEQVVADRLKSSLTTLPPDEQAELDALRHLSDDALWTIAREQLPEEIQARAHELMARDTLSEKENEELQSLVVRADRLMLRKAEAAVILKERGYEFHQQDFKPGNE